MLTASSPQKRRRWRKCSQICPRSLEEVDYTATAGVFSASEVGAPHERKRGSLHLGTFQRVAEAGKDWKNSIWSKGLSNHPEVIGEVITDQR